jgi:hypothetical protein
MNIETIDSYQINDSAYITETDPVLQSWNNLCTKIIQKNLLPLQIHLDKLYEDSEFRGRLAQNLDKSKVKL